MELTEEDWRLIRWCVFTISKGFVAEHDGQIAACKLHEKLLEFGIVVDRRSPEPVGVAIAVELRRIADAMEKRSPEVRRLSSTSKWWREIRAAALEDAIASVVEVRAKYVLDSVRKEPLVKAERALRELLRGAMLRADPGDGEGGSGPGPVGTEELSGRSTPDGDPDGPIWDEGTEYG